MGYGDFEPKSFNCTETGKCYLFSQKLTNDIMKYIIQEWQMPTDPAQTAITTWDNSVKRLKINGNPVLYDAKFHATHYNTDN